jgi:hypothetical protein
MSVEHGYAGFLLHLQLSFLFVCFFLSFFLSSRPSLIPIPLSFLQYAFIPLYFLSVSIFLLTFLFPPSFSFPPFPLPIPFLHFREALLSFKFQNTI